MCVWMGVCVGGSVCVCGWVGVCGRGIIIIRDH